MKAALLFALLPLVVACTQENRGLLAASTGGNADEGRAVIRTFGCGSCHTIPGIREANGKVAPPLTFFADRTYIAGRVPNTPANLVLWISNPPAIDPRTAMPDLGLSEQQSRDVAAYLYTLK